MTAPPELAVVIPIFNEEANIGVVLREWTREFEQLQINFSFLAINDGSRDGTSDQLQSLAALFPGRLTVIEKANAGHGLACRTGYDFAASSGCEWVLQIDSDGQCDPAFFSLFWESRHQDDCLFGLRTSRDDGAARSFLSAACRLTLLLLCGLDLKDANVPYRLIRTGALTRALSRIPADFELQNLALTIALRREKSLRWKFIPIHFRGRQGGSNSLYIRRILEMGWHFVRDLRRIKS